MVVVVFVVVFDASAAAAFIDQVYDERTYVKVIHQLLLRAISNYKN